MSNAEMWATTFGDEYTVRNERDYSPRRRFFEHILNKTRTNIVLEVGCNTGMNLGLIKDITNGSCDCWGVDVNQRAVNIARTRYKECNTCVVRGGELPFRDGYFDLVFTAGVLIHQKPEEVDSMMQEIIRTSGAYVLAVEYAAETFMEVPYHGKDGALFKGPFGDVYEKRYGLRLIEHGELGRKEGFDDCDYWLFSTY